MEFCDKCGIRLITTIQSSSVLLICPKCKHENQQKETRRLKLRSSKLSPEDVIVIGKKENMLHSLSTVKMKCIKCGHNKAFCRMVEIGDEEDIIEFQIYKCIDCGYTWRERG
jgi:DNA-directed RNA polymerase subunit M/transcription elongation factor TFIIS